MKPKYYCLSLLFSLASLCCWGQVTSFNFDPAQVNPYWSTKMDSIFQEDQKLRLEFMTLKNDGASPLQLDSLLEVLRHQDQDNLRFVTNLIEEHGWLGPQQIGLQGVQALFLVIQHADLATQKKYYPLMLIAEQEGKMLSSNVAMLEDRIAIREGRPQTYGSQGFFDDQRKKTLIYPLVDAENIDMLRNARGLPAMKDYMPTWSLDDYKSYLPYATQRLQSNKR